MEYIMERGPWNIDNNLLVLKRWKQNCKFEDYEFKFDYFWLNVLDLPADLYTREVALRIVTSLFDCTHVQLRENLITKDRFFRLRVSINTLLPLQRFIRVENPNKVVEKGQIKYERLPTFCFRCGRIGHKMKICNQLQDILHQPTINRGLMMDEIRSKVLWSWKLKQNVWDENTVKMKHVGMDTEDLVHEEIGRQNGFGNKVCKRKYLQLMEDTKAEVTEHVSKKRKIKPSPIIDYPVKTRCYTIKFQASFTSLKWNQKYMCNTSFNCGVQIPSLTKKEVGKKRSRSGHDHEDKTPTKKPRFKVEILAAGKTTKVGTLAYELFPMMKPNQSSHVPQKKRRFWVIMEPESSLPKHSQRWKKIRKDRIYLDLTSAQKVKEISTTNGASSKVFSMVEPNQPSQSS